MPNPASRFDLLPVPETLRDYRGPIQSERDPQGDHKRNRPWLDEELWGHRLFDSQSAWLIFLEFLSVAEGLSAENRLLTDDAPYPLSFKPAQRMHLRNVIFASDEAVRVAEAVPEPQRWDVFLAHMSRHALGLPNSKDFSYLKKPFENFDDFIKVLGLLRASTVERESNKRWSSRFLFPFGPHAIYEDLQVKDATRERQYINFGRTGELLYLMLARSSHREELGAVVGEMVQPDGRWDRLVSRLQPPGDQEVGREFRGNSFLPYTSHPIFDALAQDWLAVRETNLPSFDAYPHLVALSGMHLVRYFLTVARAWGGAADGQASPPMVCEIITPRKTLVRELSIRSFGANDALSTGAVERTVARIERTEAWQEAVGQGFDACRSLLVECLNWGDDASYSGSNQPQNLLAALKNEARRRHEQQLGQFHRTVGRDIGLVSRRATNRFRYAPTDDLIKSLLVATVPRRMEYAEFLRTLYCRYGLVIGVREAREVLDPTDFDEKVFQANSVRLEERLASLGLVRRLSDACAYVVNPDQRRSTEEAL